jgi:UDP-N-acetylmuramoyl-L-alanyl-D-glutamate--2,6-diaminopimelate ligase
MILEKLLNDIPGLQPHTLDGALDVRAIRSDSRLVQAGDLFVAVRGTAVDGHQYLQKALDQGAVAVVADQRWEPSPESANWPLIVVEDTAFALGHIAAAFYGHPSRRVHLIGVTGTNGKTTVTTLLWQFFTKMGHKCGLIGTVENRIGEVVTPSTHTTPDAIRLQQLLADMVAADCTHVFMETSSHAIHQHRIAGCVWAGAVFTNLTHDHLDYHGTFAAYRDAKKMLFDGLSAKAFALTNHDDRNGTFMLQNTVARTRTYGLKKPSDYKAKILDNGLTGLHLRLDDVELHARVIGHFNAYNLLAVYGVARELGVPQDVALPVLSDLRGADGRFEYIVAMGRVAIVDYAHTPDALEQVLDTIVQLRPRGSRIITVVGCGGDRDKTKRPIMARIAAQRGDQAILTSDNPRTESPAAILADMEAGLDTDELQAKTLIIENREQAIKTAVRLSASGDIILVAGKGHEKYQEIQGVKHDFDDMQMLQKYLKND